ALLAPFANPRVAAAGGRVRLRFAGALPGWWDAALATYLAAYDLGPEPADLATRPWYDSPRGLNLAVRRDALLAVGGFNLRLGPRAGRPSVGEESDLCLRLLARGHEIRYVPGAAVEHLVDPARLHPRWFFHRAFCTGRSSTRATTTRGPGAASRARATAASGSWWSTTARPIRARSPSSRRRRASPASACTARRTAARRARATSASRARAAPTSCRSTPTTTWRPPSSRRPRPSSTRTPRSASSTPGSAW